ncbi:MAG TPA: hypothetical protein VFA07_20020 [Chthonomonadaceae bacterium]|nr:hypothetical protein [Chthonomonadaceae bacterium]
MADTTRSFPVPQTEAELIQAIDQCLEQMEHLRHRMEQDQEEIDRLKAETRAILAQLKAA